MLSILSHPSQHSRADGSYRITHHTPHTTQHHPQHTAPPTTHTTHQSNSTHRTARVYSFIYIYIVEQASYPTPVGPRNTMDAMGFEASVRPARARCTASATTCAARLCPTTRCSRSSCRRRSLVISPWSSLCTGIPVQAATTSATSSSPTVSFSKAGEESELLCSLLRATRRSSSLSSSFSRGISPYL